MRLSKVFINLFIVLLCCQVFAQTPNSKQIINDTKDAIVLISVKHRENGEFSPAGTGWLYKDGNHIATAAHVVSDTKDNKLVVSYSVKVTFTDGEEENADTVLSKFTDIAILTIKAKKERKPLVLADKNPELCDFLIGSGHALGKSTITIFVGIVSGESENFGYDGFPYLVDAMQTNAIICPGHSGSAALNNKGEVIGLIVAESYQFPSRNYFIPKDIVEKELKLLLPDKT